MSGGLSADIGAVQAVLCGGGKEEDRKLHPLAWLVGIKAKTELYIDESP